MQTPDPLFTSEQIAAFAAAVVAILVTQFKLDVSDDVQALAVTLITSVWTAFTLYHAARVRGSRALNAASVNVAKRVQ